MTSADIRRRRLASQRIGQATASPPADVVTRLGAVQAQDYAGAKWAIGLRSPGSRDADLDRCFDEGLLLRTHLLRPTWHFVAPADIRWMLSLTAPRVHVANGSMYRKLGLDAALFDRGNAALNDALSGGNALTREESREVLERAGIAVDDGVRLGYLMMRAELDGVVCSGPRRGKQFTYMLLEERVPPVRPISAEAALTELARRYFITRGPARVRDFAKWSGLTVADARAGLEAVTSELQQESLNGDAYWFLETSPSPDDTGPAAHLISIYDEYVSSYRGWGHIVDSATSDALVALDNALQYIVLVDGRIVGTWRRTIRKRDVLVELAIRVELSGAEWEAVDAAAGRYGAFIERSVVIEAPTSAPRKIAPLGRPAAGGRPNAG